jgi:hypothetical protein
MVYFYHSLLQALMTGARTVSETKYSTTGYTISIYFSEDVIVAQNKISKTARKKVLA